jgi:hypothetical protein
MNWKEKGKKEPLVPVGGAAPRRYLAAPLVPVGITNLPGLRTETKGGTFSPETLVPTRSPGLDVFLDRD